MASLHILQARQIHINVHFNNIVTFYAQVFRVGPHVSVFALEFNEFIILLMAKKKRACIEIHESSVRVKWTDY